MVRLDTPTKRARIVTLKDRGVSSAEIAQELGGSKSQVNRLYRKWKGKKDFYGKTSGRGRKPKLNPRDVRYAERLLRNNKASDVMELRDRFFPHVSHSTLRRNLHAVGLRGFRRRKVPLITKQNRLKRIEWAGLFRDWTVEDWKDVGFADESNYGVFGCRNGQWTWRRPGEALDWRSTEKTVKHRGGKVCLWGMVTAYGVGRLVRIHGNLNGELLVQIMEEDLMGSLEDLEIDPNRFYYAHDNDRKNTGRLVQNWFTEKNLTQLKWPASSPDMNIQEHVWAELETIARRYEPAPRTEDEMWEVLQWAWSEISDEFIASLYASLPHRIKALTQAKGWNTKY
ncbi:hypothetical protein D9757_007778 [Collybiopsis confluens]|uniref:Transposase n=1 Tax=Collybiopsis confluens TaxID=2823264 RepID=A0A8H5HQN3_9AGAR|nr:hypothetical protein D9757_014359 [Collybiopsis confluens]KAF5387420.1 hypothetical protein D9757_007778 [Collybiopsis confluens]